MTIDNLTSRISFSADEGNGIITVLVGGVVKGIIDDSKGRKISVFALTGSSLKVLDRQTNQSRVYNLADYLEAYENGSAGKNQGNVNGTGYAV